MDTKGKLAILKSLDTKDLITKIGGCEKALETALLAEADFKSQSHGYLGAGDCQEVKRILAELAAQGPPPPKEGKITVAERETWLTQQRVDNKELNGAITKQRQVFFVLEDLGIKVEMAKRRLAGVLAVLELKTAQIKFLAE